MGAGVRVAQRRRERAGVEQIEHRVDLRGDLLDRPFAEIVVQSPRQPDERRPLPGREPDLDGLVREVAPYQSEAVAVPAKRVHVRRRPQGSDRRARPERDDARPSHQRRHDALFLVLRGRRHGRGRRPAGDGAEVDGKGRANLHASRRARSERAQGGGEPAIAPARLVPADVQRVGRPGCGDVEKALVLGSFLRLISLKQVGVEAGTTAVVGRAHLFVQRRGDSLFAPAHLVVRLPRPQVALRDEDDRKLEALRPVHGEQPDRVRVVEHGQALPRHELVAAAPHVGHELVQRVVGERPRDADEFSDVGQSLLASLQRGPDRLVSRQREGSFEERGGRGERRLASQIVQHLGGPDAECAGLFGHALRRLAKRVDQTTMARPQGKQRLVVDHE